MPIERIGHRCVQRCTTHRPVLRSEGRQGRERHEQVRTAAAGVVEFQNRLQWQLTLDGEIPGMVLGVAVVAWHDSARIQTEQGRSRLANVPAAAACRQGTDYPNVRFNVALESSDQLTGELMVNPVPGRPNTVARDSV